MESLKKETETYQAQRDALLASSEGKFALIHGDQVVGTFETELDATNLGYRMFGNEPFLVKQVLRVETPLNFISSVLAV